MKAKIYDDKDTYIGEVDGSGLIDFSNLLPDPSQPVVGVENLPKMFAALKMLGAVAVSLKKLTPSAPLPVELSDTAVG